MRINLFSIGGVSLLAIMFAGIYILNKLHISPWYVETIVLLIFMFTLGFLYFRYFVNIKSSSYKLKLNFEKNIGVSLAMAIMFFYTGDICRTEESNDITSIIVLIPLFIAYYYYIVATFSKKSNEFSTKSLILSTFFLYLLTGIVFSSIYINNGEYINPQFPDIITSIYFSFTTLTTTGYGDIKPLSYVRLIVVLEQVIATSLFAMFISNSIGLLKDGNHKD